MIEMPIQWVSYIVFGGMLLVIFLPFIYRENLYRQMAHKMLGIFVDAKNDKEFLPCRIINEYKDQTAELEPPKKHKELYPALKNYVTKVNCVTTEKYPNKPIIGLLSIRVKSCMWRVGNPEPVQPIEAAKEWRPLFEDAQALIDSGFVYGTAQTKGETAIVAQDGKPNIIQKTDYDSLKQNILGVISRIDGWMKEKVVTAAWLDGMRDTDTLQGATLTIQAIEGLVEGQKESQEKWMKVSQNMPSKATMWIVAAIIAVVVIIGMVGLYFAMTGAISNLGI